jgi:type VI secretion system protein ImpJ
MENNQRVVWSEGMLLTPQIFQQWDQYYDRSLNERLRGLFPFGYGALSLDFDHDGLANGRVTLLGFQGVLPDGLVVKIPDEDMPPQTRLVTELFSASVDHVDVFLAVPVEQTDGVNFLLDGDGGSRVARYSSNYIERKDSTTGSNSREVLIARKNLRILFSGEPTTDMVVLKIGELLRTQAGAIALKETYIPPCLWISASPYLLRLLRGLIELLSAQVGSYGNAQRGILEAIGMDLGKYHLVAALTANLPAMQHMSFIEKVHPEILYLTLGRLAGALTMLAGPLEEPEMLSYRHDNLTATFEELDHRIRSVVDRFQPTHYLTIGLEASGDNVWIGRVPESRLFASAQFFLVATGDLSEDQIRQQVPQFIRIGSPTKLKEIVAAAMPGVRLYHTPRPPATLPVRVGQQYFRLDDRGVFWEEIKKSQIIALHVPQSLQSLRLQLLATKE